MEWYVYYHSVNYDKINTINIFKHDGFRKDVEKCLNEYKNKDKFADKLRFYLSYYFASKCEWELVLAPWVGGKNTKPIKIDVYDQVMNNWDVLVDYVWKHRVRKSKRNNDDVIDILDGQIRIEDYVF